MVKNLVSIVIPVYNIGRFLPDFFKSIENQTYKDIECIFVNDGSTDNSLDLINSFCENHSYARVISQENKGLAVARATGIAAANGEFLYNADPDDMIHPQLIEIFVDLINEKNADFVCGCNEKCSENRTYENANFKFIDQVKFQVIDENNICKFVTGCNIGTNWSIQVKLYRMSILKQIPSFPQITPPEFSRGEDLVFNSNVINYCKKAVVVNHVLHLWRQRRTSLTHTKKFNLKDLNVLKALDPCLASTKYNQEQRNAMLANKAYQASMLLCVMKKSKHYVLNDVENAYKIYKENVKYCKSLKYHRFSYVFTPLHIIYWIGFVKKTRRINKH